MPSESQIPIASQDASKRFATRVALFYGTLFGMTGTHLPFFTVWLKAVGIDAFWIGLITAVPPVTRFTALPLVTGFAERRQALRGGIILTAFATALGFFVLGFLPLGTQHLPVLVFLIYVLTCCLWTPMVPLTDAYALRGVKRYGLNYGPLRLWGSAAFVLGALVCGMLFDLIAAKNLIWIIAGSAALGALASLALAPLDDAKAARPVTGDASALLRDGGFLAVIVASALIQGSHAAYYIFASIAWQQAGYDGLTIAVLWVLGVIAEIVLFALSPRFTLQPSMLVVIAALSAAVRWVLTAQDLPLAVLAIVQLAHALSFGLTQVGIMGLMLRHVPGHVMARAQGYLTACGGIVAGLASVASGTIYEMWGQGIYYGMAVMAALGGLVIWLARDRLSHQPHKAASGG
ncbi:3-phenylpropionic acid transporter [Bradyrhizobium lablabi]|uniref:3-phenylpropionic acid transporter n=1 Tax=Bradyrhizobium lablabi TaxID=722472 RepID=A0A0R3MKF9_9BRAD|nr:MFS transporter [Bradyrhizobium lablabi]KRR17760.1 3-phenylpropionic acid transporter [Bradyrhizobium lablabi]